MGKKTSIAIFVLKDCNITALKIPLKPLQVILGRNIFPNRLLMESLMNPVETINVNVINQQNLMEMNEAIVRESDEPGKKRVIEGQKVILGNVELNNLQIHGSYLMFIINVFHYVFFKFDCNNF